MESGQVEPLEYILSNVAVGVAILDAGSLCIRYINPYLHALLELPWRNQDIKGRHIEEVLPAKLPPNLLPLLQHVATTGQSIQYPEAPFEGFLESRGRTYWHISIERRRENNQPPAGMQGELAASVLLITIKDVTESVRSRLHLNAIHYISSAIAGPSSLHLVLDRILQVLQDMFGSKRCAIFLINSPLADREAVRQAGYEELSHDGPHRLPMARVAAQKGLHQASHYWNPQVTDKVLPGRVIHERHSLIITDTSLTPEIELPFIDYDDRPVRPGSVLSVPIFEPHPAGQLLPPNDSSAYSEVQTDTILGTIEVYHRRARGFPAEEVRLLEQFAQQAGLAIQHARLFHSINRLARTASRHARQQENVMQAIPDGVVICDPRWHIVDVNQAARHLMGWTKQVLGLFMGQALTVSRAIFQDSMRGLIQSAGFITYLQHHALEGRFDEAKMIGADGRTYSIRTTYTPIQDELGEVFAFIVIYHDVTDQVAVRESIEAEVVARTTELKQRNQALQQVQAEQEVTSARMSLLLERLPSGILLVSAQDGCIKVINQQAIQLLQQMGVTLEPLDDPDEASRRALDRNCEQLLRPIPMYAAANTLLRYEDTPLYKALRLGQSSEAELHTHKKDGQDIYLLVNAAPLLSTDGSITSAILVYQEITRIKNLERSREDFFTTMAHELKTPLANVRAHLSALLANDLQWSNEERYDFLQTADEQVERLVGMINHFLDASRVEVGALRLEIEPILVSELCEDLQDRLEALINSSQRNLHLHIQPALPAARGDYELIISVLTNLLSNAFRYAPEGDVVILRADALPEPGQGPTTHIKFSVTDHGPGISAEQQKVLFTRFSAFAALSRPSVDRPGQPALERREKATRWSPATGLGLYISRGIIEAHESQLMLDSFPGQGATFSFTLPVFKQHDHKKYTTQEIGSFAGGGL
ncbi:MAG: hypothetical protein NVS4B9_04560 [Ktedonobacteraceae bacterium]